MHLTRLRLEQLRLFEAVELEPGPRVNLLLGANGAGKTSLLEAVHLLGYGRSFRSGGRDALIRRGAEAAGVFAEIETPSGIRRVGLRRGGKDWEARLDGAAVSTLSALFEVCAVVCFEPGSHELIAGPAELRRRFLDWGLFHVEPDFIGVWRSYQRALKQRNALLRQGRGGAALEPWEHELARNGGVLHRMRLGYVASLGPRLAEIARHIFPSPGEPSLHYQAGWRVDESGLDAALVEHRERDLSLGYTSIGPHRANWSLRFPALPSREVLSRGQEKLTALCCVLAQAQNYATARGDWPVICVDDLGSELDHDHQQRTAAWLQAQPAQVWVTGTSAPGGLDRAPAHVFHVEQGAVRALL
jgi:DNA replication and repair protein RecF